MNLTEFHNQQKQLKNARRPQAPKKRRDVSLGERLLSKQLDALKIEYTQSANGEQISALMVIRF